MNLPITVEIWHKDKWFIAIGLIVKDYSSTLENSNYLLMGVFRDVHKYINNMTDISKPEELFFEVPTLLGFAVRVSLSYRNLIASIKHPVMLAWRVLPIVE